jgi:hypothetical protein
MAMIPRVPTIAILLAEVEALERGAGVGVASGVVEVINNSYNSVNCNSHCCTSSGSTGTGSSKSRSCTSHDRSSSTWPKKLERQVSSKQN